MRAVLPVLLLLSLASEPAFGWGFDGHRRLLTHAQDPLPGNSCLRQWLAASQDATFQNQACDPDRWRDSSSAGYDPQEAPRHFIELDWVTPITDYPRDWAAAQAQLGFYAYKDGYVPWRVQDLYFQLVAAFQSKDNTAILPLVAHLSHYVTDSFSVLHDTKNFDPDGLHARWESDMLANSANIDGITSKAANYYGTVGRADPVNMTFDIAIVGNGLLATLVAADQSTTRADGGHDMPGFYAAVSDLTARRWGDALTLFASILASAWVDAGKPLLVGMPSGCSTSVPQGDVVLKGYPMPGGWTPADGGVPDAGQGGGGGGGGTGGGGGSGGSGGGGGGGGVSTDPPPPECGCSAKAGAPGAGLLLAAVLALRARRMARD